MNRFTFGHSVTFGIILLTTLLMPAFLHSQQLTLVGSTEFFVSKNQKVQAPDGFFVKDAAINILPATLTLNNGAVFMENTTSRYKVHSVPASGNAVFYSAIPLIFSTAAADRLDARSESRNCMSCGADAGLTVQNGTSGISDFLLQLDYGNVSAELGNSSIPVIWEVSQTLGTGFGDLTFSWGADLESTQLANKRLYVYSSGAWTALPSANTTAGNFSLSYSGYSGTLSATRFGIASGLSATPTPTDPACTGGTGSLSVLASGGLGAPSFRLDSGAWQSTGQFNNLAAGTYTLYVKDDTGDEISTTVTINEPPPAMAMVTGDLTVCTGESTTLTASGGSSYTWNGGLGTNASIMVSPTTTTTYSVTVTNANGCLSTASVTVQSFVLQPPVVTFSDNTGLNNDDGIICAGSGVTINLTGGAVYDWSDGASASSRLLAPACTTPFSLTVTDANGCTSTTNLQIVVNQEPSVTQITPVSGTVGSTITINGQNLNAVSAIRINGQPASGLTIVSPTQLTASRPTGGAVTQIELVSPCGTVTVPVSAPTITSFTPGAGNPGTIMTLTGTNMNQLVSATVGGVGAVILSRTATSARVLVMPGAVSGSVSVANIAAAATATSSFTVNGTPHPYFQQGSKQTNSGQNAIQGSYVSVSADGNTAVIGAPGDNGGVGASWIYVRSGTAWSQQAKLVGAGAIGPAKQGTGVGISSDGNTVVVGGPADNSGAGAIWIFTRSGTTWTQQGSKITGTGAAGPAQQGINVAISGDGGTVASGGFADNNYTGAVWTFARYGNSWSQLGDKVTGSGVSGAARQGSSLALSGNGTRMIMGGYQDDNRQGAAWIFNRTDCGWIQQGSKLVGTGGSTQAWQGYSVSLSADGNTAAVGGNADNNLAGAAWIFTQTGGNWTQQAKLVGTQAAGAARQGNSVSLSADANTIMVGGTNDDSNKGAVWVYKKNGSSWQQQGAKIKGSGAVGASKQGASVSLSGNGTTGIIGGPNDNTNKGAFWVYIPASSIPSMEQVAFEERSENSVLRLDQNIPNPFTGTTAVTFSLPEACVAEWEITDLSGRVIQQMKRAYPGGENSERFVLEVQGGVYFYRLKTPFGTAARKMLMVE